MSVASTFKVQNWIRETRRVTKAQVLAFAVSEQLLSHFPQLFSSLPRVKAFNYQGWTNFVIQIDPRDGTDGFVMRLAHRSETDRGSRSLTAYEKERAILELLAERTCVPVPIVRGSGDLTIHIPGEGDKNFAFLIQTRLPFKAASGRDVEVDREHLLTQLGKHCRLIHDTPVRGFGLDFDEKRGRFTHSDFRSFIESQMTRVVKSPVSSTMKNWLSARVEQLMELDVEPRLFHRDLLGNLGNVLVDDRGGIRGIIDWEFAGGGPAFHIEMASFLYVLSRDGCAPEQVKRDLECVLSGYGMSHAYYTATFERDIETLVLLDAVGALVKFEAAKRYDTLTEEPWRKLFAERASAMCEISYSKDRRRKSRAQHLVGLVGAESPRVAVSS